MGTKHTIEQELLAATKQKEKGKKESVKAFMARVGHAVSDLSDDDYEKLSAPAQAWFTQAAEALSEDTPAPENIKPFSEFEEEAEPEAPAEETAKEEQPPVVKTKKKSVVIKKEKVVEPDKSKKAKADGETMTVGTRTAKPKESRVKREGSVADTIRFIMCDNPTIPKNDVGKALKEKKLLFDQSRLDQVYSATARVLQILQELKKLK